MAFQLVLFYTPFGMLNAGRNWSSGSEYRYGFNGKENDGEIAGNNNDLDFGARMYDSRLGRWFSVDPLFAKYPYQSTYLFVGNSPIINQEIDGRDYAVYVNHDTHTIIIKATYYTKTGDADAQKSATDATLFWNQQSGKYQYIVKDGKEEIAYDIQFDLTVEQVDNPINQANADRMTADMLKVFNGKINVKDGSSNVYEIKPDSDPAFVNNEEGVNTNGVTTGGAVVRVKDSRKNSDTGGHEVGHTLGLGHFFKGILTADSNSSSRTSNIYPNYVKGILKNAFKVEKRQSAKAKIFTEAGVAPEKFEKGTVIQK